MFGVDLLCLTWRRFSTEGGDDMRFSRVKIALVSLASVAAALLVGGNSWGP